jgi:hypothetical protein
MIRDEVKGGDGNEKTLAVIGHTTSSTKGGKQIEKTN